MLSVPHIGTFPEAVARIRELSRPLGRDSAKADAAANESKGRVRLLFDGDGFVGDWLGKEGPSGSAVAACLPLDKKSAARVLTLHQLMRAAVVVTAEAGPQQELLDWISVNALMHAVITESTNADFGDDVWITADLRGVRERFVEAHPGHPRPGLRMTLDRRFTARTHLSDGTVTVSVITREYLMRINVMALNLAVAIIDGDDVPGVDEQRKFTDLVLRMILALRGDVLPSQVPTVRPRTEAIFRKAQIITSFQMVFLVSHEFAHLLCEHWEGTKDALEEECDRIAFESLEHDDRGPSQAKYIALRWLFEILAFDRVVNEALFYRGDDWENGVDWLQSAFRRRRRDDETIFKDPAAYTSPLEAAGSLLLIFARHEIRFLGREELLKRRRDWRHQGPSDVSEFTTRKILELIDPNSRETHVSILEALNGEQPDIRT